MDIRQDECERIDNKVDVLSKTFLGLTVSCARCHDHKFDPIRAQDYYAMSGFILGSSFRQVRFEAMENNRKMATELQALRERFKPKLAKLVERSRGQGVRRVASLLIAAREVMQLQLQPVDTVVDQVARNHSLDAKVLQRWVDHLRQASTNRSNPLHLFAKVALDTNGNDDNRLGQLVAANRASVPVSLGEDVRIIADYTQPGKQSWKADGEAFGSRPLVAGDMVLAYDATNPIARVMTYGAARRDLFWNRLKTAAGNENDSRRLAATSRAGQMMRTPART